MVEAIAHDREMVQHRLFQVMFILQNTPEVPKLAFGDVEVSSVGFANTTSKFDITLSITENRDGLGAIFEYNTDLFREETIARMILHFSELLSSVVKHPQQNIGKLQMMSRAEKDQLLIAFNSTQHNYPANKTTIDFFEEQVRNTPGATAVIFENQHFTYQQLNERSNQLAHYIIKQRCNARNVGTPMY